MAENDYYYVPSTGKYSLASMGHFCKCSKCGRKILVSLGLIGTTHHLGTTATCADCLEINEEFKKEYPDIVKRIEEWQADKELGPQYLLQQNEEIPGDKLWPLEFTPRPGTITGDVVTSEGKIQSFLVTAEGKMDFTWVPYMQEQGRNFILNGVYEDYIFKLKWYTEPPPEFTLKVNYEYGV